MNTSLNPSLNQNLNAALSNPTHLAQPDQRQQATAHAQGSENNRTDTVLDETKQNLRASWPVIRAILVVWAVAVWLLLVLMPGVEQITDAATAMLHLPNMLIGLALVGAMFAAYNLRSDGHMLWFLGVLLLLAGWM